MAAFPFLHATAELLAVAAFTAGVFALAAALGA